MVNFCQYCGKKLDINIRFCPDCGWEIKEDPNPNFQAQSVKASQNADASNPYEIDNPNPPSQPTSPPMYSGIHGGDDNIGLAIGAALLFGRGRRIYRRRRRRSIFF